MTNHLVPALQRLEMTEWLRDTVDIHELELPPIVRLGWLDRARGGPFWITRQTRWLREPRPARLPWLELRRAVWLWKSADITPVRIVYERNGIRRDVPDASSDPELGAPLSWWSRHLMAFRAVELAGNPVRCRW